VSSGGSTTVRSTSGPRSFTDRTIHYQVNLTVRWATLDWHRQHFSKIECAADNRNGSYLTCQGNSLQSGCAYRPPLYTTPPFITKSTCSRISILAIGSPLTATMSANLPGSILPTWSVQPIKSAAFTVPACRA
jgi:hypothetical protein